MPRSARFFVYYSLLSATLHFVGETWIHLEYGQFLPMLIVDYIAIALVVMGAVGFLKLGWGPGLLCGGWGFTFCLNYRTFFWRVETMLNDTATAVIENTAYVLGVALAFSTLAFLYSVWICIQHEKSDQRHKHPE
ncbi:MAG: hypothetical protein AAF662_07865 [Pseudomonadota bacterium]